MYKLLWNTIWGILVVFRHDRGVHYVYLGTIGGCIITIRGGCAPPKRLSENTDVHLTVTSFLKLLTNLDVTELNCHHVGISNKIKNDGSAR